MKRSILVAAALSAAWGASLLALPAAAQTAAATLPNAFGEPARTLPSAATPAPGPTASAAEIAASEQALRAVIGALQTNEIDYSVFSRDLAEQIRERVADFAPRVQRLGAIRTIEHRGRKDDTELFRVVFEKQATDWVIAFDRDRQINALLYRPASGD